MAKCKYCSKEFVWEKTTNEQWIPHIDGKIHDCRGLYNEEGKKFFNCKYCSKKFVWDKAPNEELRPHIDGKIHDCQNLYDVNGNRFFKCNNCGLQCVWKKASNGEPRPYINTKMHDCEGIWGIDGHHISAEEQDELDAGYEEYKRREEVHARSLLDNRCEECDGRGCGACDGTGEKKDDDDYY